jgi:hypothetical protein
MRNTWQEERLIRRLFKLAGAGFLLGVIALAIGTELLIVEQYSASPASFWCWQGVWAMIISLVISKIADILKQA